MISFFAFCMQKCAYKSLHTKICAQKAEAEVPLRQDNLFISSDEFIKLIYPLV